MAYSAIAAGEVDADSPLTDTLGAKLKDNFDAHEGRLNATDANTIPWNALQLPINLPYVEVTGALTLGSTHGVVLAKNSGGSFDVSLPLASLGNRLYIIGEDKGGGGNETKIARTGSDLLVDSSSPAGTATPIGMGDGTFLAFFSDGVSKWRKIWSSIA